MITLTKKPKTVLRIILAGIKLDVKGLCVQLQVRTFGKRWCSDGISDTSTLNSASTRAYWATGMSGADPGPSTLVLYLHQ